MSWYLKNRSSQLIDGRTKIKTIPKFRGIDPNFQSLESKIKMNQTWV